MIKPDQPHGRINDATPWPVMQEDTNHPELRLSPADAELLDRLLAGEPLAELIGADEPDRAEHISRLLSLLDQWEANDAEPGLSQRTVAGVLACAPVSLSPADGEALDALLDLRRQGLSDGPMPAGVRGRVAGVQGVLGLLNHATDEPVPGGLADRTVQTIEQDRRSRQQRSALSTQTIGGERLGTVGIRQIAATAALLILAVSILLPMLSNAKRDAQIAQCSQNLAGLGADLQQVAIDNKGATHRAARPEAEVYNPLAKLARTRVDGTTLPASEAGYFVLLDQQRITSQHLACPTGSRQDPAALYNGQNPAAGGPFRIFLKARPIFADTNPLYRVTPKGLVRQAGVPSMTRSANHGGKGQNVLISDGSVQWMIRPAVQRDADNSDNIWLYQPDDNADRDEDIFLTP
ncbi:MAG: hypothetical protein KTR15_15195 [Phycisphaeraceae bacterium]|nr:hypothetical protein [Phycisphaeraceae bacterium]